MIQVDFCPTCGGAGCNCLDCSAGLVEITRPIRAILVGRHTGAELPGVEVVEQRAITWPAHAEECTPLLTALFKEAAAADLAVLFQNTPGQLTVALANELANEPEGGYPVRVGLIVSVLGARPAAEETEIAIGINDLNERAAVASSVCTAIATLAPNARVTTEACVLRIVSTPPMRFKFSHIEWLLILLVID